MLPGTLERALKATEPRIFGTGSGHEPKIQFVAVRADNGHIVSALEALGVAKDITRARVVLPISAGQRHAWLDVVLENRVAVADVEGDGAALGRDPSALELHESLLGK